MSAFGKLALLAAILAPVQAQAMDFTRDPRSDNEDLFIYARGTIEKDDAARFQAFIAAQPPPKGKVTVVVFTSLGGMVDEAKAIGAIIEKRHYLTYAMGDQCSSACVLAWAAGVQKFVMDGTCIGVHGATIDGVAKQSPGVVEDIQTLGMMKWIAMRWAPHKVLIAMLTTPSTSIYCLTAADLKAWNVDVMEKQ